MTEELRNEALETAASKNRAIIEGIEEGKKHARLIVPNLNNLMGRINNAAVTVEATFDALGPKLANQLESSTNVTEAAKHRLDELQTTICSLNQQIQKFGWHVDETSKAAQRALNHLSGIIAVLKYSIGIGLLILAVWLIMYLRGILA